jgi:hypothetical protein
MRAALFSPLKAGDLAITSLAETAIYSQWFHHTDPLYYARWSDGEVDIVYLTPQQKLGWAVEVKWSDRYCEKPEELKSIVTFCRANNLKRTVVTSRTKTLSCKVDEVIINFLPSSLYCYTVGYNIILKGRRQAKLKEEFEPLTVDPQLDLTYPESV